MVGAKLRVTENRCVLFDSFTCIYINKIIQIYIHTHNSFIYKLLNGIFFQLFLTEDVSLRKVKHLDYWSPVHNRRAHVHHSITRYSGR